MLLGPSLYFHKYLTFRLYLQLSKKFKLMELDLKSITINEKNLPGVKIFWLLNTLSQINLNNSLKSWYTIVQQQTKNL